MKRIDMNQPTNHPLKHITARINTVFRKVVLLEAVFIKAVCIKAVCINIKSVLLSLALGVAHLTHAQVSGSGLEVPKTLNPVAQRYLAPTIKADLATMAAVQALLASKRSTQVRDNDYVWVKAQRWLDVAQDEYRNNNRGTAPAQALQESQRLTSLLDNPQGPQLAWDTPSLDNSVMIRPDLWQQIQALKDKTLLPDDAGTAAAKCTYGSLAYAEVQLSWAAWVSSHYGWRSALPYTSHAEKKIQQAVSQYKACEALAAKVISATPQPEAVLAATPVAAPPPAALVLPSQATTTPAPLAAPLLNPTFNLIVPSTVHFAHNQSSLNLDAQATLRLAATVLSKHAALPIVIEGYADDTGSLTRNKRLSLKRAAVVKTYLQAQGIAPERMQVQGLGTIASQSAKRSTRTANPAHRRAQIKVAASLDHPIRQQLAVNDSKVALLCANRLPCKP